MLVVLGFCLFLRFLSGILSPLWYARSFGAQKFNFSNTVLSACLLFRNMFLNMCKFFPVTSNLSFRNFYFKTFSLQVYQSSHWDS